MAIEVSWYDSEKTIRLWRFTGDWTWSEFFGLLAESVPQVEARGCRIDTIVDLSETGLSIPGLVENFRQAQRARASNVRLHVIVGGPLVRAGLNLFAEFLSGIHERYVYAPSIDAALAMIARDRDEVTQKATPGQGR